MNERDALLQAICANPEDDTLRLVFADWLQEHGEEARAEFIRVQVEAEHYPLSSGSRRKYFLRERELLEVHETEWRSGLPNHFYGHPFIRGFLESAKVQDLRAISVREVESLFEFRPLIELELAGVSDPGFVAEIPVLSRLRRLSLQVVGPSDESLERLIGATNLPNLTALKIYSFDFLRHPMAARIRARFKGALREGE